MKWIEAAGRSAMAYADGRAHRFVEGIDEVVLEP
jgi:hypothetical protein